MQVEDKNRNSFRLVSGTVWISFEAMLTEKALKKECTSFGAMITEKTLIRGNERSKNVFLR